MDALHAPSMSTLTSLLTPSESNAIQSFFTTVHDSQEWNIDIDVPRDREALAKATKDLMSLETPFTYSQHHHSYPPQSSFLPRPPTSDSSSRTPTPTSAPVFQLPSHSNGRLPNRTRHGSTSQPYPPNPSARPSRSQSSTSSNSSNLTLPSADGTTPPPPKATSSTSQQKPALLSASQKKANHIQSEQKRRANIRRGYEALCDCVPALREAIRLEEEANASGGFAGRNSSSGKSKKGKGSSKNGKELEEKIDGRAGPRSENVVLSKTIDYINELLDDRSALLMRLHRARSTLPPGHPALIPSLDPERLDEGPLWEREWKGGSAELCNNEGEGDDDSS